MARNAGRRPWITLLAIALLAVALVLVLRPPRMTYLALLRQGDAHAAGAERTAAVAAYRQAARLRPADPAPYLRLARVYLDWGRTTDALVAVTRAGHRLGAGEGRRLAALAADTERMWIAVLVARSDWAAVVEHAQRLLPLVPAGGSAARRSGLYAEGSPGALAEALDDASAVRHVLARAHVELGEWDAARAGYEALLRADPADPVAHEWLGALLLGDDDAAAIQHLFTAGTDLAERLIAALGEAGAADDRAYTDTLLGQVLFGAREWALAARLFERALQHNPSYADAHAYLGHALDQMGRSREAGEHLRRAVALAPDAAAPRIFLGLHYDRLGHFSAARAQYEAAYDLDPDNPATCVEIGQAWAAEGRYAAAEIWLRQAVSLQPDDPVLWEILARFYLDHNIAATGQGVAAAERLVELSPDDARAHDLRGWAALQVEDYDTAMNSLLQATALEPALAPAHYHLGLLWELLGARGVAWREFARALDLDTTGDLAPLVERVMSQTP